ncbi:MAG: outer membrane beta-barrel protein [Candidatus Sericytochromatia bacterium]
MMFSKKNLIALLSSAFVLSSFSAYAAEEPIKVEGYVDSYISFDNDSAIKFDDSKDKKRTTNNKGTNAIGHRKNEFNINLAQVTLSKNADWYRGRFTLSYGTAPLQSWPMEYFPVQEANAGIKLCDGVWLDAGVFLTHIGLESLLPKNNHQSILSMTTMNEPFYQNGVKLSYKPMEQLELQLHALNGLGIMEDSNNDKSLGWLVSWSPNANFNLTDSGYVGNDEQAGAAANYTVFENLNFTYQPLDALSIKGSLDAAFKSKTMSDLYLSALLSLKYSFNKNFAVSLRGETTMDDKKVLTYGMNGVGATLGLEYKPTDNSYVRLEGRQLMMSDKDPNKIFLGADGKPSSSRMEGVLSMGVSF